MMLPTTIHTLWLLFFAYCCIGWVVEELYCSIPAGHFINRGFLNGPYLPIYGSGSVAALALFGNLSNPIVIFLLGGALCCALEWVTSSVMERVYHARWWDYSNKPLNLDGRIWAGGFVEFGVGICLVVLVVNPPLMAWLESLPSSVAILLAILTFACMTCDLFITHKGLMAMRKKMDALMDETRERMMAATEEAHARAEELAAEARSRAEVAAQRAEVARQEARSRVEAASAEAQHRLAEAREAALQQVDVIADDARAQVSTAREQMGLPELPAAFSLPKDPAEWERLLDWHLGTRLRMTAELAKAHRPDLPQLPDIDTVAEAFRNRLTGQERRVLGAFPELRPSNYRSLAQELARHLADSQDDEA